MGQGLCEKTLFVLSASDRQYATVKYGVITMYHIHVDVVLKSTEYRMIVNLMHYLRTH